MEYVIDFGEFTKINNRFFNIETEEERKPINECIKKFIDKYDKKEPIIEESDKSYPIIETKEEPIVDYDPYKEKINLCMDFQQKVLDSLSNIYKDDNELMTAKNAVKSFMGDFINAKAFEDESLNDLTEYFEFISSLFSKLNNEEIKYVIDLLKNKDYASLQDLIDSIE